MEIGGAIYNFVLQGVEAIGKAMSWVFEKITVGIQRLIDFLGFIFSWQDMLTTSDSIVAVINAALDYGQDQIPGLKAQEQAWVRSLRDSVQNRIAPVAAATGTETKDPEESASMDATKDGVAYNWTSYQVTYGGLASNSAITPPTESSATSVADDATLQDLWNQISNIFATVEHLVSDIGQDVRDLFTTSTTSSDIYARLQEQLINSALDTVQNVADALLTALSLALSKFRDLGNQSIQIPIFSSLWKKITNGRDFTVFNAFALLLAIPSTIVYKLVRKKAPPSLKDMNKNDFSAYVNGTSRLQEGVEGFSPSDIGKVLNVMNLARLRIQADLQTVKAFATKNTPSGETIDTGLIFLGIATAAHGWPVAGSNDMALRWTVSAGHSLLSTVSTNGSVLLSHRFKSKLCFTNYDYPGLVPRLLKHPHSRHQPHCGVENRHPQRRHRPSNRNLGGHYLNPNISFANSHRHTWREWNDVD